MVRTGGLIALLAKPPTISDTQVMREIDRKLLSLGVLSAELPWLCSARLPRDPVQTILRWVLTTLAAEISDRHQERQWLGGRTDTA
jgi:hypothetical protein